MAIKRELAHRLFAQEYNGSRVHLQGEGDMAPSYVVSPLGAKINRLHVVGVCTEVEPVGESGDLLRARISDGTGVFTVYAGQYQQEAMDALDAIASDLPAFVAVTGKARTYEPEPGSMFVSVRPESVTRVDDATRNQWLLDTARRTTERLAAIAAAPEDGSGSEQVVLAQQHYGLTDTSRFSASVKTALQGLLPGGEVEVHTISRDEGNADTGQAAGSSEAPAWTPPPAAAAKESDPVQDQLDDSMLATVQSLAGTDGAQWEDILSEAKKAGASPEDVEESLNRLMDKGLVYEPTLGVLKTT